MGLFERKKERKKLKRDKETKIGERVNNVSEIVEDGVI